MNAIAAAVRSTETPLGGSARRAAERRNEDCASPKTPNQFQGSKGRDDMDMRERIARAICRARFERENLVGITESAIQRDLYVNKRWSEYENQADAVLAAMRTPTEAMREAPHEDLFKRGDVDGIWQAMIDAARV